MFQQVMRERGAREFNWSLLIFPLLLSSLNCRLWVTLTWRQRCAYSCEPGRRKIECEIYNIGVLEDCKWRWKKEKSPWRKMQEELKTPITWMGRVGSGLLRQKEWGNKYETRRGPSVKGKRLEQEIKRRKRGRTHRGSIKIVTNVPNPIELAP